MQRTTAENLQHPHKYLAHAIPDVTSSHTHCKTTHVGMKINPLQCTTAKFAYRMPPNFRGAQFFQMGVQL